MRSYLVILFFVLVPFLLFAQNSSSWISNIDTLKFKTTYQKKKIPKNFYSILKIKNTKQIANPNEEVDLSCTRKDIPGSRFNWMACDKKNHWIVSITNGGIQVVTKYIFIEKSNDKLTEFEKKFTGADKASILSLSELILKMKNDNTQ